MKIWNRSIVTIVGLVLIVAVATPAAAAQFGLGLHYLKSVGDFDDVEGVSTNDFSIFGSISIPVAIVRIEGDLEWVPDYLGSDADLINPAAFGFLDIGMLYGGVGIGIGYSTGDGAGWATNPWYALRAGIEFGLGGLALDGFMSYRFQSASFVEGVQNANLDAFTLGAQVKFGG